MATRLYGKYRAEDMLMARFPDEPTHIKRLARLLPEAELGTVSGAAARLCRWHKLLDRVGPGTYQINEEGKAQRARLRAALKKEPADFEAEWAALPTGEGVTMAGEPLCGDDPTPERLERAHAFMRRLEAERSEP